MNIMIPAWVDGTLQPVEKLEAHKLGLKHKAISVFLFTITKYYFSDEPWEISYPRFMGKHMLHSSLLE